MKNSIYLFAAFGMTWTIIFIYIFRLFRNQKILNTKIEKIKKTLQHKIQSDDSPPGVHR